MPSTLNPNQWIDEYGEVGSFYLHKKSVAVVDSKGKNVHYWYHNRVTLVNLEKRIEWEGLAQMFYRHAKVQNPHICVIKENHRAESRVGMGPVIRCDDCGEPPRRCTCPSIQLDSDQCIDDCGTCHGVTHVLTEEEESEAEAAMIAEGSEPTLDSLIKRKAGVLDTSDSVSASYPHYYKPVPLQIDGPDKGKPVTHIDIYAVLRMWAVGCPARQHAIKKLMCTGARGSKGYQKDLKEANDAITRAGTLEKEFELFE